MATRLGQAFVTIQGDLNKLQADLDKAKALTKKEATGMEKEIVGAFERTQSKVSTLVSNIGTAIAAFLGARELVEFAKSCVTSSIQAERLSNAFKSIYGDSRQASSELNFLRQTANTLGLDYMALADSYKGISAAARDTTLEGQGVRDIFLAVAQASSVLGLSADNTQGALMAISQMISKGTVQAEELRGQLGERLPGAFKLAARGMGLTEAELSKLMQTGKVTATEFIPRLAKAMSEESKDGLIGAANSTTAAINRLNNEWTIFKQNAMDSGPINTATSFFSSWLKLINEGTEANKRFNEGFKKAFTLSGNQIPGLISVPNIIDAYRAGNAAMIGSDSTTGGKFKPYTGSDASDVRDIFAYGGTGAWTPEQERAIRNQWIERGAEIYNETRTALERYNSKIAEYNRLLAAGDLITETYNEAMAQAREEYEKGYQSDKLRTDLELSKSVSQQKLTMLSKEMTATEFAYSQGQISEQQYFAERERLQRDSTAERIRMLQKEQAAAGAILQQELSSPTKSPLEKDLLKQQYTAQVTGINAEIASQQAELQKTLQGYVGERQSESRRMVDMEVQALQEIMGQTQLSFAQRAQAGEEYLAKRITQIQLEQQANVRAGMNPDLAERLAMTQMNEAATSMQSNLAQRKVTLEQVNVSYAQLTGTMEDQLRAQLALNAAMADQKIKEAGGQVTELGRAYKAFYDEQARIIELNKNGSFWEGMSDEARNIANSIKTPAMQGREAMRAFENGIKSTADALAEFCMTGKMDFASLATSIIKDLIRIQIEGFLTKALFGGSGSSGGGLFSFVGGLFGFGGGGGSAAAFDYGTSDVAAFMGGLIPGYASGGDFQAGQIAVVGERGPEIVKFGRPGTVIPNNRIASSESSKSMRFEIVNPPGQRNDIESVTTQGEGEEMVARIVLKKASTSKKFRDTLSTLIGGR